MSLLEAGEYRVAVASDSATLVSVDRGSLDVSAGDVRETVQRGQAVRLSGTNPAQVADVTPGGADSFDAWSAERDRYLSSSASAQYVSRDIPGSADLDEAGNWQVDLQYGPDAGQRVVDGADDHRAVGRCGPGWLLSTAIPNGGDENRSYKREKPEQAPIDLYRRSTRDTG